MQLIDLFSGVGGFSLAGSWMGWKTVQFVEIDPFCRKILNKHWPEVPIHSDIKTFGIETLKKSKWNPSDDTIIVGGFPCQPFSLAGKQRGNRDDRYLWPEMLRVIREVRPSWIVGENVPGIIGMELENICLALESEGYEVQPFIIPSASIGAWDKRERVWIIAHNHKFRCNNEQKENRQSLSNEIGINKAQEQKWGKQQRGVMQPDSINTDIKGSVSEQSGKTWTGRNGCSDGTGDTVSQGLQRYSRNDLSGRDSEQERQAGQANWLRNWIEVASELCGSNAGVSSQLDGDMKKKKGQNRTNRIKALGNSVNPYVVFQLFKTINHFNKTN